MKKVTFVIGLPGSGKTCMLDTWREDKRLTHHIYEDWMEWDIWINGKPPTKEFNEFKRYQNLLGRIRKNNGIYNVVIVSTRFCDNEFLCKSEYYLKVEFPDVEVNRIYFENDVKKCIKNILRRDTRDGKWSKEDDGSYRYVGSHLTWMNNERVYEVQCNYAEIMSKNYNIPLKYNPIPVFSEHGSWDIENKHDYMVNWKKP